MTFVPHLLNSLGSPTSSRRFALSPNALYQRSQGACCACCAPRSRPSAMKEKSPSRSRSSASSTLVTQGQIALRTDPDWERNIEAQFVSREDCCWEFSIETSQPFFYFKPILIAMARRLVARRKLSGRRNVGGATGNSSLFSRGSALQRLRIDATARQPGGMEHRFRVFLPPGYRENTLKRYPVLYMHDGNNFS